jgi:hypothetical protein
MAGQFASSRADPVARMGDDAAYTFEMSGLVRTTGEWLARSKLVGCRF